MTDTTAWFSVATRHEWQPLKGECQCGWSQRHHLGWRRAAHNYLMHIMDMLEEEEARLRDKLVKEKADLDQRSTDTGGTMSVERKEKIQWITKDEEGHEAGHGSYADAKAYAASRLNQGRSVEKVYLRTTITFDEEIS